MQIHWASDIAFVGVAVATVVVRIYATRIVRTTPDSCIASRAVNPVLNAFAISALGFVLLIVFRSYAEHWGLAITTPLPAAAPAVTAWRLIDPSSQPLPTKIVNLIHPLPTAEQGPILTFRGDLLPGRGTPRLN